MRERAKRLEDEVKKTRDLEKKCKLLEETIKAKNPNSIPMMLQAVKETASSDKGEVSDLKSRIKSLEVQLDEKDKEFERKLRTLRQETERVREQYEAKQGKGPDAKRVAELEGELEQTKLYYQKRIRELEDKYRLAPPAGKDKKDKKDKKEKKDKKDDDGGDDKKKEKKAKLAEMEDRQRGLEEQVEKLTKERNLLAQKVVNLETQNNKRRSSFSGA